MVHSCLEIPEILSIICQILRESYAQASLAALAATGSWARDAALDALWSEQHSFVPLLSTLPQHTVLDGPITPETLERTQSYASRISSLSIGTRSGGINGIYVEDTFCVLEIDEDALHQLFAFADPQPLLPRLERLDCDMLDADLMKCIPTLLSFSIVELTMGLKDYEPLIQALPSSCPRLVQLTILQGRTRIGSPFYLTPSVSNILAGAVNQMRALQHLSLFDITLELLACVGKHPTIRSLQFPIGDRFVDGIGLASQAPQVDFENVMQSFEIILGNPTTLDRLFESVRTPIQAVSFVARCYEDPDTSGGFDVRQRNLDMLAHMLEPAHVKEVLYYHDCDIELSWGSIPAASILQLTQYPHISHLGIDCWVDAADADLLALARALPQLEFLVLDTHAMARDYLDFRTRNVRTTLGVLPGLAHCCPNLRVLCIRLDATAVPTSFCALERDARAQSAIRLYFAESPLTDPVAVAAYLRHVFPRGCSIASRPPREGMFSTSYDGFWDDDGGDTSRDWPVGLWPKVREELSRLDMTQGR
ncbi:hypothetical protein HDZ31DRAFT_33263 [Schizophyllum fasciatum]